MTRQRRGSVLDLGGPNSINNFVGAINRSTSFGQFLDYHPSQLADENASLLGDDYSVFDDTLDEPSGYVNPHVPVEGGSTVYQTTFNAVNVLVGMGILSLPLGFRLAGWIPGFLLLALCPIFTRYTALLLGRILERHPQLKSYSDIGQISLSKNWYGMLLVTFIIDLFGASLTLVILFTDSFSSISTFNELYLKAGVCCALFFLSFLPLAALSLLSVLGISCVSGIIIAFTGAGFLKNQSPGSILDPMPTNLWPQSPMALLVATGIFMAPWGGHVVFPELYRDMRHPHRYNQAVTATYLFAWSIDLVTASLGFLMFGALISPELTSNILVTTSYPAWLRTLITIFMGLLPLSKLPLFALPVISFFQGLLPTKTAISSILVRFCVASALFVSSIYITDFGRIQSLLGSLICITTCITAPLVFYLINFGASMSPRKNLGFKLGVALSIIASIAGTVSAIVTS